MSLPQVTVVVPVQNHRRTLPALLCALATTDWPELDVVFVDCGSTDGGLELLRDAIATTPRHRLLERHGSGRASALNAGFAQAATGDVVRLHADVVPDGDDWLRRLHAVTLAHPECGIVGAKLTLAGGRVQSCGRNLINGLGIVPEWSDRRWLEDDRDEGSRPTEVDGVAGGLCYIRRATLDATGGLDANFDPVFGDDDDFCLQARWHGFAVFVEPGVRGVHFAPRQTTMTGQLSEPTGVLQRALDARGSLATAWFGYFRAKWGFDPAAPDLHEIRRRYGHTRICWQIGERLLEDLPATPAVDVCFPTWNSMAVLPRAMAQLAATRWSHVAVWITDNGSTDGTVEYLESLRASFPFPLHVECLRQNIGCAQALNLAIERGSAPLVARIDDDTFVEPDWLERLVPRFHQRPYAGVIGPKVLADSAEPALQSGPSRVFPHKFPVGIHEHERASGLARVVTLRGCCNLYRRSVFAEVGLLDPRFSPSQFDEWDHHIAVAVRGYEVLYDGSASVRHLITAGRGATPAALGNFRANLQKSNCKWGEQHFQRLERAIDLSIDGRFLPADGDTGALRARLPAVPSGPPRPVPRDAEEIARWAGVARRRGLVRSAGGPLDGFFADLIAIGNEDLDDGGQGLASTVVR
ncbi:MAG: glycosyltransferase, partial [Planctomycetes bacterium]|nr:glycosyltransferase [Planctomycetota bacterium]